MQYRRFQIYRNTRVQQRKVISKEVPMDLDKQYERIKTTPSDINEHIDTLCDYASRCESILELGVRSCVSTFAFIKGLTLNGKGVKTLVSNDLTYNPNVQAAIATSFRYGVSHQFVQGNDLSLTIQTTFDLTFIDTWHVYAQLSRELAKFSKVTKKYIILHDTEVDKTLGESLRCGSDVQQQARDTGFPVHEITQGLQPAIDEFLEAHKEWRVDLHKSNNNGLTVLAKN